MGALRVELSIYTARTCPKVPKPSGLRQNVYLARRRGRTSSRSSLAGIRPLQGHLILRGILARTPFALTCGGGHRRRSSGGLLEGWIREVGSIERGALGSQRDELPFDPKDRLSRVVIELPRHRDKPLGCRSARVRF